MYDGRTFLVTLSQSNIDRLQGKEFMLALFKCRAVMCIGYLTITLNLKSLKLLQHPDCKRYRRTHRF